VIRRARRAPLCCATTDSAPVGELDDDSSLDGSGQRPIRVLWSNAEFIREQRSVDHRVAEQQISDRSRAGIAACHDPIVPSSSDGAKVVDEVAVGDGSERRSGELLDDGEEVAFSVGAERGEVGVGVGEQPGGNGERDVAGESLVSELGVYQCAAGSSGSVRERMDGWRGGTNRASWGLWSLSPIHTGSSRQRPAISVRVPVSNAACIARIASASMCSASAMAAVIARWLATISVALRPAWT
jgi:hypothetical protein